MTRRLENGGRAAVILLACALGGANGCGVHHAGRPDEGTRASARGDLISARDRERMQQLVAARSQAVPDDSYRLGPDDLLDVRIPDLLEAQPTVGSARGGQGSPDVPSVAGAPAYQQGLRVSGDGYIGLPMLGRVAVRGLTPSELEADLAARLVAGGILRHPQVSVTVAEFRSYVVSVTGAVERPGLYPLTKPGTTVADFVRAAGGPNRDAGRVVEFVPAHGAGDDVAPLHLDLDALLHPSLEPGALPALPARAGDVVNLVPSGNVQVDGWVEKPGSYPITRGLTVSGAVAAAGGVNFAADRHHATVKRILGSGEDRSFEIDLAAVEEGDVSDVPVIDGDVLVLNAAPSRLVPYGMWNVLREMVHVGGNVLLF